MPISDPETYHCHQIGVVHSPYGRPDEAPHQGFADDRDAEIRVFDAYSPALAGLEDVLRVTVVYWAHLADRSTVTGDEEDGVFTRRSPHRPNPLAICTCPLLEVNGNRIRVRSLDAVDGSPVLDVKPALQVEW